MAICLSPVLCFHTRISSLFWRNDECVIFFVLGRKRRALRFFKNDASERENNRNVSRHPIYSYSTKKIDSDIVVLCHSLGQKRELLLTPEWNILPINQENRTSLAISTRNRKELSVDWLVWQYCVQIQSQERNFWNVLYDWMLVQEITLFR